MNRSRFLFGWVLTGLMAGGAGCHSQPGNKTRLEEVERLPRLESRLPKKVKYFPVIREYAATIEAMEKVDLCAQVRGVVKDRPEDIDISRTFEKGEPLLTLDIPDILAERANKKALWEQAINLKAQSDQAARVVEEEIKEAEALVKSFQAEVEFRQLEFKRRSELAKTDTVTKQLVDEATLQWQAAQARRFAALASVQTKKARLHLAEIDKKVADNKVHVAKAEWDRLEALVGFATLKAPFNGVINKLWFHNGASVKENMPLLSIHRTDKVRVILDVPERDVPYLMLEGNPSPQSKGNSVQVTIPALVGMVPPEKLKGVITLKAETLDPATRTMRVEVHLDNKSGYLRPQMTGKASVVLAERHDVFTVPSSALVRNGPNIELYYVEPEKNATDGREVRGMVKRLEVELGLDDGKEVEIRNTRLTGQERIITKGAGVVRLGDQAIAVVSSPTGNGD